MYWCGLNKTMNYCGDNVGLDNLDNCIRERQTFEVSTCWRTNKLLLTRAANIRCGETDSTFFYFLLSIFTSSSPFLLVFFFNFLPKRCGETKSPFLYLSRFSGMVGHRNDEQTAFCVFAKIFLPVTQVQFWIDSYHYWGNFEGKIAHMSRLAQTYCVKFFIGLESNCFWTESHLK